MECEFYKFQGKLYKIKHLVISDLCTVELLISKPQKHITMSNLLYIIAVILIIFWAVGFFAYSAGGIIHVLLVIAAIAILLRIIQGKSVIK